MKFKLKIKMNIFFLKKLNLSSKKNFQTQKGQKSVKSSIIQKLWKKFKSFKKRRVYIKLT